MHTEMLCNMLGNALVARHANVHNACFINNACLNIGQLYQLDNITTMPKIITHSISQKKKFASLKFNVYFNIWYCFSSRWAVDCGPD